MGKLAEFTNSSKNFNGITMNGCYNISIENFELAYEHYLETGENVLDEHAKLTYLKWRILETMENGTEMNAHTLLDYNINKYEKLLENNGFWNIDGFINEEEKCFLKYWIKKTKKEIKKEEERRESYKYKRKEACLYTNDSKIRKSIFERDGRICQKCGSTKNLTLDHVSPIRNGVENKLNNLQVLCKSCNSKKGAKTMEEFKKAQND